MKRGMVSVKTLQRVGYIMWGVLLSIILLFTSVELIAFNTGHYQKSFIKYNITEATGMDMENLEHTMDDLLEYLKDDRTMLDTRAVIKGEEREVFGERERLHMIDVKELFIKGRLLRNISVVLLIIITPFLIKKDKGWKLGFSKTLIWTSIINIAILLILLILMKIDFYKYFTYFHLMFFSNDLWILDPDTDVLIQMVPEAFFYSTATKIVAYFLTSIISMGIAGYYLLKKYKS